MSRGSRRPHRQPDYVNPRHVEDHWKIYRHGVYLEKPVRRLPAWLLPLLVLLLLVVLIFWAGPALVTLFQAAEGENPDDTPQIIETLYDASWQTVRVPVADVFTEPDLKADRLTQVIYNEPVHLLEADAGYGFIAIETVDGSRGYIRQAHLSALRDSIEPGRHLRRLVVASASKRVMSHASRGTLLTEVYMGTVLYADYEGDSLYRVTLPDGGFGWMSGEGLIVLDPQEAIAVPQDGGRYFSNSALAFNKVTTLGNGQTVAGASLSGIARIAASVNGVVLPRSHVAQQSAGVPVLFRQEEVTGLTDLSVIQTGDLIFFRDEKAPDQISGPAICIGGTQVLFARRNDTSIRVYDLAQTDDLNSQIIQIRRIFN